MTETRHYIAVDLGAESGRVMLVAVTPEAMTLQEVRRFANGPVERDGALHWDVDRLMTEIKAGIGEAATQAPDVVSIGVDSWGVDFGLLDANGRLIEPPYHYRDRRTEGYPEAAFDTLSRETIYGHTGIQFMCINTLYQLLACQRQRPELLAQARTLLMMANLVMYALTGEASADYTLASTSQLLDMRSGQWSDALLRAFDLPRDLLPTVKQPGEPAGLLRSGLARELGCRRIPVVTVGTHDTASAVAAVPVTHDRPWAYLSSGTWSLMGVERAEPILTPEACALSCTNEGGVCGTIRLLTNIMGLWLVQECKRHWAAAGQDLSYGELTEMAAAAPAFQGVLDPDDPRFLAPGDMPAKIRAHLTDSGQDAPTERGTLLRLVLESLALRYDRVMRNLESLSGPVEVLHIVGGGTQNRLLNQLTADATGKTVVTGPIEATVAGNVLIQALAAGQIPSLEAGRRLVAASADTETYRPQDAGAWAAFKQQAAARLG